MSSLNDNHFLERRDPSDGDGFIGFEHITEAATTSYHPFVKICIQIVSPYSDKGQFLSDDA